MAIAEPVQREPRLHPVGGLHLRRAQSFYDFSRGAATSYSGASRQSDTGDGGKEVFAYTAQFGNGFSASISAESRRTTQIVGQDCTAAL